MNIAIGSDHRGFQCKEYLKKYGSDAAIPIKWIDVGTHNQERSDYPLYAHAVVKKMMNKQAERGILLCGSGIGMAIYANRFAGIFAGVAWNVQVAQVSREDDNTNILVIPTDFVTSEQAVSIVHRWLTAIFKKERYQERINMINAIDCACKTQ